MENTEPGTAEVDKQSETSEPSQDNPQTGKQNTKHSAISSRQEPTAPRHAVLEGVYMCTVEVAVASRCDLNRMFLEDDNLPPLTEEEWHLFCIKMRRANITMQVFRDDNILEVISSTMEEVLQHRPSPESETVEDSTKCLKTTFSEK